MPVQLRSENDRSSSLCNQVAQAIAGKSEDRNPNSAHRGLEGQLQADTWRHMPDGDDEPQAAVLADEKQLSHTDTLLA